MNHSIASKSISSGMLLFSIAIFALSGCTTMTKEQCGAVNWYGIGYEAAMAGRTAEQAPKIGSNDICLEKYGMIPDFNLVDKGYAEGLLAFCTNRGGLTFGRGGGYYNQTCPEKTEAPFLAGYQLGRIEYMGSRMSQLEHQVKDLRSEVDDRNRRIDHLQSELDAAHDKERRLR